MTEPRLTVAMSVYNNAPYLRDALDSICGQSFGDFECLIVDDGSTDGSSAILDEYAARDSRIRVEHRSNHGLIASLNHIVGRARAPVIARMDGDDLCEPERFARQMEYLDAHPECGVLGTNAYEIDECGRRLAQCEDYPVTHEDMAAHLLNSPPIHHSSVTIRTDLLRSVGGYHPAFRHCEDYDLWLRLVDRTRFANLAAQLIAYRRSEGQVSQRHAHELHYGAAIARQAHAMRQAGLPDPTLGLNRLPEPEELNGFFADARAAGAVRNSVARNIVYSPEALAGQGFHMVLTHIRETGDQRGFWKTAARMVKFRMPVRAARLTLELCRASSRRLMMAGAILAAALSAFENLMPA